MLVKLVGQEELPRNFKITVFSKRDDWICLTFLLTACSEIVILIMEVFAKFQDWKKLN